MTETADTPILTPTPADDPAAAAENPAPRTVPVSAARFWNGFGGLTLATAAILALTGVVLSLYYVPSPDRAYASAFYIDVYVRYGWLVRSAHWWSAQLMIAFVVVHMVRAYLTAAYRGPREMTWVGGVLLFIVTLSFAITGSLLPWDERAYTGTAATLSLIRRVPFVGELLARFMAGGSTVGAAALSRFYSLHIVVLPIALVVLLAVHVLLVRRHGISDATADGPRIRRFPDLAITEATATMLLLAVITVLCLVAPATLGPRVDASAVHAAEKPAWYLLFLWELARIVPPHVAAVVPLVLVVLLGAWPFIDRGANTSRARRLFALGLGVVVIAAVLALTVAGAMR